MARKTKRRRSTKARKSSSRRRLTKAAVRFRRKLRKVLDGMRKRGRLKGPRLYGETQHKRRKRHGGRRSPTRRRSKRKMTVYQRRASRRRTKIAMVHARSRRRVPVVARVLQRHALRHRGQRYHFPTKIYYVARGLTRQEALRRVVKKHRRDFRGFTYEPSTGRAAIV